MRVVDVLLPRRCGVCGRVGASVCATCLPLLVRCAPPWCERCGAPGPWPVRRCAECAGRRIAFTTARAGVVYEPHARAFVSAWKERGRRDLTSIAGELVTAGVARPGATAVTFVPADRNRELLRGHSTAAALAHVLGEAWGLPVEPLLRRRGGVRQRGLSRDERRRNASRSFVAARSAPAKVCLVDDVYTTGSTANACASALRRAGAHRVDVVCFARAVR